MAAHDETLNATRNSNSFDAGAGTVDDSAIDSFPNTTIVGGGADGAAATAVSKNENEEMQ